IFKEKVQRVHVDIIIVIIIIIIINTCVALQAAWRMPGQYLVVLHEGTHESQVQRTVRRLRARAARRGSPLEVLQTYSGVLQGFLVKMSHDVLHLALKLPHVQYVEEDSFIFAQSAPWNLQRLLQPQGGVSVNGTYLPPNDGEMAKVYLMDGSVQSSHREVEGRVLITDFNNVPEEDGVRVHRQASQCDGHGTHLAGVVTGSDSGVARGAGVNLVRVLNCQGKGTVSGALAACRETVARGAAVVVAAAGNYREDACLYSPASEPEVEGEHLREQTQAGSRPLTLIPSVQVITVGAVNSEDQLMSQGAGGTNFGRCVDLFAPGIAAVILSSNQKASPVQVLQLMLHHSVSNTINFLSLSETHRLTTPNLVAAMPPANNPTPSGELLCRSVWSERSGLSSADAAVSRCRVGEEMMGCSSYAPDGARVGETLTVSSLATQSDRNSAGAAG
ncbi:hypothetical protein CCH79_00007402, partial [Gambusia affinis]